MRALALLLALIAGPAGAGGVDLNLYLSWFAPGAEDPHAGQGIELAGEAMVIYPLSLAPAAPADPIERAPTEAERAALARAVDAMAAQARAVAAPLPEGAQVTVEWSIGTDVLFARGALVLPAGGLPPEVAAMVAGTLGGLPPPAPPAP
jgi:hypothetical protein